MPTLRDSETNTTAAGTSHFVFEKVEFPTSLPFLISGVSDHFKEENSSDILAKPIKKEM